MAQIIKTNLNINPGGTHKVIHLSQYDKTSRTMVFTLTDFSDNFTPESGAIATVRGTKPDHTGFEYQATLSGSTVTVPVEDQMTAVPGTTPCEIRITGSDGSILGTARFALEVEPSALSSDTVISETKLPLIEKAGQNVQEIESLLAQTKTSESNAKSSQTEAANSATAAKESETNAASSAASALDSATKAAGYAGAAEYSLGINPKTGHMAIFYNKQS